VKPLGRIRVRRRGTLPRALHRPVLRDLIETTADPAAPDEILDTVTGPFGRVVEVDGPLRKK
jgi:hypothetical protein